MTGSTPSGRRAPTFEGGPGHLEREAKLEADPDLVLPDLTDASVGIVAVAQTTRQLDATYYDADDLRLLDQGVTVRRRTGEGTRWTVKLPADAVAEADHGLVSRREVDVFETALDPPAPVLELVGSRLGGARLGPVARLVTDRRRVDLRDPDGRSWAELADDLVSVRGGADDGEAARFREIEVELAPTPAEGLDDASRLDAVVARLVAAGARPGSPRSKIDRALGLLGRR